MAHKERGECLITWAHLTERGINGQWPWRTGAHHRRGIRSGGEGRARANKRNVGVERSPLVEDLLMEMLRKDGCGVGRLRKRRTVVTARLKRQGGGMDGRKGNRATSWRPGYK